MSVNNDTNNIQQDGNQSWSLNPFHYLGAGVSAVYNFSVNTISWIGTSIADRMQGEAVPQAGIHDAAIRRPLIHEDVFQELERESKEAYPLRERMTSADDLPYILLLRPVDPHAPVSKGLDLENWELLNRPRIEVPDRGYESN